MTAGLRSVAVVGGGPGGLLTAAVLKERRPDLDVAVYERNAQSSTFGFGVVFSGSTLDRLASLDPALGEGLASIVERWSEIELHFRGRRIRCSGNEFSAVSRQRLLNLLHDRATNAGARIEYQSAVHPGPLMPTADLVVAADGVNSAIRQAHAATLRPSLDTANIRYIWFGATTAFDCMRFAFEETEHGWFSVHAYPYESGHSTFLVDTDVETWRRAGFDKTPELSPGESDDTSLARLEALFAEHLDGGRLIGNNSRWLTFETLTTATWHEHAVGLIGDAAHTAHFSVGSGTTMALEDALTLGTLVAESSLSTLEAALGEYEARRRPAVERVQAAAQPSLRWWEHFRNFADALPPERFALHFLTRSGRVTATRLARGDAAFVRAALETLDLGTLDDVLAQPLRTANFKMPSRVADAAAPPWNGLDVHAGTAEQLAERLGEVPAGGRVVAHVIAPARAEAVDAGCQALGEYVPKLAVAVVAADGSGDDALLAQRAMAETMRLELGATVALESPSIDRDDAITEVLSGRVDIILVPAGRIVELLARPTHEPGDSATVAKTRP